MNSTNIYIPALLKFVDDKVSIPNFIQIEVNSHIKESFDHEEIESGFNYSVSSEQLKSDLGDSNIKDINITIYYYHHRIIFHYELIQLNELEEKFSGTSREIIKSHFENNISTLIKLINEGVVKSKYSDTKRKNACKVVMYYSYPIIFQKYNESITTIFSSKLETMFFRIYLPNWNPLSYGAKAYIRISIPSFHLYYNKKLTDEVKSNVINAIYQTVLYRKKTEDSINIKEKIKSKTESNKPFDEELLLEYNKIDEVILKEIWQYSLDSMGGKISDNQQAKVSQIMFWVSLISFFTAVISLVIAGFTL